MKRWTLIACALATVFFALAQSAGVYEMTSPFEWSAHVLVRKLYSVAAFALVGYALRRALDEYGIAAPRAPILAMTAYSALIEIAQALGGSREGPAWNAVDVACGTAGGAIAVAAARLQRRF